MKNRRTRLVPWFASAIVFSSVAISQAQTIQPPQHRASRTDTTDTTPMTVVASSNSTYGAGWYWVPIDGAKCRHNTDTGIAVRLRPYSNKVVITMQGGGACYNFATCGASVSEFGLTDFQNMTSNATSSGTKLYEGVWKLSSAAHNDVTPPPNLDFPNKLADEYTEVFVPYCSGDLHVGAKQNVTVPWVVRIQNFQGAQNTNLYFRYVVDQLLPTLQQSPADVVLSGFSAGGFGAALNAKILRDMLPSNASMTLLTDSAPMFNQTTTTSIPSSYMSQRGTVGSASHTLFRPCFLQRLSDMWGLENSVLKNCGAACYSGNWMNPMFEKFLRERPDVFVAVTSPTYDAMLRTFMGTLTDYNCAWDPTEAQYLEGLTNLRKQMQSIRSGRGNFATYFVSSDPTTHVAFTSQRYFSLTQTTAGNVYQPSVRMQDWVQDLINRPISGTPISPMQVGP